MAKPVSKAMLARASPAAYAWYASGESWLPAEHLLLLSQRIVDVATGRCPRLMVFMPPRHGKSELISRYTPAWYLGRFPDRKVMLTSYADTFAASWGRRARDTFKETNPRLFGLHVKAETSGGQHWEVEGRDGIMVTAGVGGGLTGKGADLLIIDDPIKNAEEAQSERIREAHHDWWKSTARTRLQKGAGVILVMTRWHEDDLAGRLLADAAKGEGDEWDVLCLEGLAEGDHPLRTEHVGKRGWRPTDPVADPRLPDPLGRAPGVPGVPAVLGDGGEVVDSGSPEVPGEVLWPDMFDAKNLTQTRLAMGPYWFGAMYQQRPAPAEGMLFKKANFRYFVKGEVIGENGSQLATIYRDAGPEVFDVAYGTKFCTVDVADSEKKSADFTVVSTWVVTVNKDLLLWDRERVQFEGPNLKLLVRRIFFEQRPAVIAIERLGFGTALIRELLHEGLPVIKLEPDTDKVTRALPACARYEEHRIFHPRGPAWVHEEWEPELLAFPNSRNDDQVDTVSYAALQLPLMGGFIQAAGMERTRPARRNTRTLTGGLMKAHL